MDRENGSMEVSPFDRGLARVVRAIARLLGASAVAARLRPIVDARPEDSSIAAAVKAETDPVWERLCGLMNQVESGSPSASAARGLESSIAHALRLAEWANGRDDERTRAIDAKAQATVQSAATSLSVFAALGGWIATRSTHAAAAVGNDLSDTARYTLLLLYVLTLFAFVVSIGVSVASLRVRSDWRGLDTSDLFAADYFGQKRHGIYLAMSLWILYRNNVRVNGRKARLLFRSQVAFTIALAALAALAIVSVLYLKLSF